MALNQARQERFLERQRGAGTRQIKDIAFNLILPGQEIAPLQPRKSGRSRKTPQPEILPPQRSSRRILAPESATQPLKPQKSGRKRKTPQQDALPQGNPSRRTPAPDESLSQRSSRRTPVPADVKKRGRKPARETSKIEGKSHSPQSEYDDAASRPTKKRRKLKEQPETIEEDPELRTSVQEPEIGLQSQDASHKGANGPVKKRKRRKSIGQQATKKRAKNAPIKRIITSNSTAKLEQSPVFADQLEDKIQEQLRRETAHLEDRAEPAVVQSIEPGEIHPSTKQSYSGAEPKDLEEKPRKKRKRVSIGQQANKRTKVHPATLHREATAEAQEPLQTSEQRPPNNIAKEITKVDLPVVEMSTVTDREELTVSQPSGLSYGPDNEPEPPPWSPITALDENREQTIESAIAKKHNKTKRKKRRSIGQQRPRKPVAKAAKPQTMSSGTKQQKSSSKLQEPVSHVEAAPSGKTNHRRKPLALDRSDEEPELTADTGDDIGNEGVTAPESQTKPKRGRPKKGDALQSNKQPTTQPTTSKARKPSIPTEKPRGAPQQRARSKHVVPITVYRPSLANPADSDEDELLSNPAPTNRKTVNAVDVLAQYTREMLPSISTKISQNPDLSSAQAARATKTVEMFGADLDARLVQLTKTLDINATLGAKVKKANQEERKLKKELKALKAERKAVEVRKAEDEKEEKRIELDELLGRIGAVVKKGWALEAEKHRHGEVHVTSGAREIGVEA